MYLYTRKKRGGRRGKGISVCTPPHKEKKGGRRKGNLSKQKPTATHEKKSLFMKAYDYRGK